LTSSIEIVDENTGTIDSAFMSITGSTLSV